MRNTLRVFSLVLFFVFFILAVGGGLFWGDMNFVRHTAGGDSFIALWKPTYNFIMQGALPYAPQNAVDVQRLVYGRLARANQNPYMFSQPLYLVLLFFPIGWVGNLALARAIWLLFLQLITFALVILSINLSRWKPGWVYLLILFLFSFFWEPAVRAAVTGNGVILQALLLFGAIRAFQGNADEFGGALIALALANLETSGPIVLVLGVWFISARRWRALAGFLMTFTLLVAVSFLVSPGWFLPYIRSVLQTWDAGFVPSTFHLLESWFPGVGARLARSLSGVTFILLIFEWRAVRGKEPHWLYWTVALTAALTPLLGMEFSPAAAVLTLPALILVVSIMEQRWGLLGRVVAALWLTLVWVGLWAAAIQRLESIYIFVYPFFTALMLYWVRWWATRPPRMWMDILSQGR